MYSVTLSRVPNEIIEEETIAEIKLDDMIRSIAAPDTTPKAAIQAFPLQKRCAPFISWV